MNFGVCVYVCLVLDMAAISYLLKALKIVQIAQVC